ncbi:hypothetical protein BP5796_01651 [Coleophoma crateriformis]|uniref:Uncharacterized protein n=1 Tax=Coleophoma crateriformis TaxID=565419 RepID=A0A3D8T108_9HELO|nr:hypothetical protein BP5796_01651 [Coleophoma crateriformis]
MTPQWLLRWLEHGAGDLHGVTGPGVEWLALLVLPRSMPSPATVMTEGVVWSMRRDDEGQMLAGLATSSAAELLSTDAYDELKIPIEQLGTTKPGRNGSSSSSTSQF